MRHSTRYAYTEMMEQVKKGNVPAMIPAIDENGEPMVWMTSVEFTGGNPRDPVVGLMWAAAASKRAYREARANGVDTVI